MKLPVIKGREVVPVRLIPFVTQQGLGQQTLSQILTHRWRVDGFPKGKWFLDDPDDIDDEDDSVTGDKSKSPNSFHAYLLNEDGKAVRMLTTEWDMVVRSMEPIEPMLRIEEEQIGVRNAKESEWFEKTLKMLPESAFMWREDFERLWCLRNGCILPLPGERPDVRLINYDAYIRQECRGLVWDFWKPHRELIDVSAVTKPESTEGFNIISVPTDNLEVPFAPPAGVEAEQVKEVKPETVYADLLLPGRDELVSKFTSQAHGLLQKGKSRKKAAEEIKLSGATLEMIGMILTNDGSENRTRGAWEKRAVRLLKGELKGFV